MRVESGKGVLVREEGTRVVYCLSDGKRFPRDPYREGTEDLISTDPLVVFLRTVLDAENNVTSGEGALWFHRPHRSGQVVNEVGEVIVSEGMRHVADHLALWNPIHVRGNINSRMLIIDLYEDTPPGSPQRSALRQALQALAMNYENWEGYRSGWTLTARSAAERLFG